jgi:uncharacterized membrane protein YsdA (DUF1294 family)/cold shock CspA family protein
MPTGRITSWDRQKGYGFIEAEGARHFLHQRDFAERHKAPELGDTVMFSLGTDRQGRTCAVQARHLNDGGRLKPSHLIALAVLLVAPTLALIKLSRQDGMWLAAVWLLLVSALTAFVYYDDKRRAQSGDWRAKETHLHLFALIGGWPGAFLAQHKLRHKVSKPSFQFMFWITVALHLFVAVDYLNDWAVLRALGATSGLSGKL